MTVENSSSKFGYDESVRILEQIWTVMSIDINGGKYPRDESEIKKVNQLLEELRTIGCLELDIIQQKQQYESMLRDATQKVFAGSWKILTICIIVVIVTIMFQGVKSPGLGIIDDTIAKEKYDYRLKSTEQHITSLTVALNQDIAQLKSLESANNGTVSDPRLSMKVERRKEYLKSIEKRIAAYKSQPVAEFKDAYNDRIRSRNWSNILFTLYLLCLPPLYYFSARIPMYMRCRRHQWLENLEIGQNIFGRVFMGIVTIFMSITPITVIREDRSLSLFSPSKKVVKTDHMLSLVIKLMVLLVVVGIIFAFSVYVLPLIVVFNFGINYLPLFMEKKGIKKMRVKTSSEENSVF